VGTRIRARGALWRVTARADHVVHLAPYEEEQADGVPTPTIPTIVPAALGDDPLIVEILSAA